MLITRAEAERRVTNGLSIPNGKVVSIAKPVRGRELPDFMKEMIGTLGRIQKQADVAEEFGVTRGDVNRYSQGKVGATTTRVDEELRAKIDSNLGIVQEKASDKLLKALDLLTTEKLAGEKPRNIASIARDLSAVIDRARPKNETNVLNAQVIVYAPQQREEKSYEVIEA